jgi:glycine cleavage system H protein
MNIPANLKYTKDHEWISLEDVCNGRDYPFCSKRIGDIVYVEVETLDQTLEKMRFWYS